MVDDGIWTVEDCGTRYAALVTQWRDERRIPAIHGSWFPPDAYVAMLNGEPVGFACFYLALSSPMAWVDWLLAKPGLPKAVAKVAFGKLVTEFWRRHGGPYQLLRGMARAGAAAESAGFGFVVSPLRSHEVMMSCPAEFLVATEA